MCILALSAGSVWLWHQKAGRRQLVAEVDGLRSKLVTRDEPGRRLQDGRPEALTGLERQPIDWQAIAAKFKKSGEIAGGLLNKNARLLAAIEAKSVGELLAMLDQIAAADLSERERDVLDRAFAAILAKKAPGVALSRFSVPGRSDWSFLLSDL